MKKRAFFLLLAGVVFAASCNSPPVQSPGEPFHAEPAEGTAEIIEEENDLPPELVLPRADTELPVSSFGEIWAYLVSGREDALDMNHPVSDLCYFGAELDSYGKLSGVPDFRNVASFPGRVHFVAVCSGRALTHFALAEGSAEREALIQDLLETSKPYHGLQIDFENVPQRDGEAFLSFLKELRAGLGDKLFSIALPARTRTLNNDVYDYEKIKPLVDRILVMAYDEHWSTSEPGPIASMSWCQRVARYALDTVGQEKLIMGLPFYGRGWGNVNHSRAYVYSGIEEILREQNTGEIRREGGIPTFTYEAPVSVTVYYEDDYSLSARLEMYKKMGVIAAGFWRLGQETPAFWPLIALEKESE